MSESPKFRVGQVVCVRDGYMYQQTYLRIAGSTWGKDNREYWDTGGQRYTEFCLRPLTKREKGQLSMRSRTRRARWSA